MLPEIIYCAFFYSEAEGMANAVEDRIVPERKFEIELFLGEAKPMILGENTYKIQKNSILIAKPGQRRHNIHPYHTLYTHFYAVGELAEKLMEMPDCFYCSNPQKVYDMFVEMIYFKEQANDMMFYSKMFSFLDFLFRDVKIQKQLGGTHMEAVTVAKKYIERNFAEAIKLKDIAKKVHLSEIYFHNRFCQAMGMSPHQYLIHCRVENAKKLLWNTEISICDVAERSGFGSQQYLNKVFKKETGITPAAYRKEFLEKHTFSRENESSPV